MMLATTVVIRLGGTTLTFEHEDDVALENGERAATWSGEHLAEARVQAELALDALTNASPGVDMVGVERLRFARARVLQFLEASSGEVLVVVGSSEGALALQRSDVEALLAASDTPTRS